MAGKRTYKFTDKKHTRQGLFSVALAVLSIVLAAAGFMLSFEHSGNGGSALGLLGFMSMAACTGGFILALRGFREEDVYYISAQAGVCVNGILFVLWALIFLFGM